MKFSVLQLFLASSALAAPLNDQFAARISLGSAANVSAAGNNTGATLQIDENDLDAIGGASIWWKWTAPASGWITVDTAGSAIDTVLAVFADGPALDDTYTVGFNDESGDPGAAQGISRVIFVATAGTEYHIAVHGFLGAQGAVAVNIRTGTAPPLRLTSLTLAPASVNVSTAAQTVTADIGIASDAPFAEGSLALHRASFSGISEFSILPAQRISGTANAGIYRITLPVSRYSTPGTWLLEAALSDTLGREAVYGRGVSAVFEYDHVLPDGLAGLLAVANTGSIDETPPVLSSFSISPGAANVVVNPAPLTFSFRITDALSGFNSAVLTLYTPSGLALTAIPVSSAQRLTGTALDGTYSVSFTLPARMPAGTWTASLLIRDAAGNPALYDGGFNGDDFPLGATSGELSVTGSPGSYWAWMYPKTPATARALPDQDLDGDGTANLLEYAFGLAVDELDSAGGELPATPGRPVTELRPGGLTMIYPRRPQDSLSGLTYTAQFSSNLTSWVSAAGGTVTPYDDQFESVTVTDPQPGGPRRYGRVKVTLAE